MKEVSRRHFLKGALAGTAAVAAVGALGIPGLRKGFGNPASAAPFPKTPVSALSTFAAPATS